jgi:hypothetical protein
MPDIKSFPGKANVSSPAESWAQLTPDDDQDLAFIPKSVHVASETGGSFEAMGSDGQWAPFRGNPGQFLPIRPKRIKASTLTEGLILTGLIE